MTNPNPSPERRSLIERLHQWKRLTIALGTFAGIHGIGKVQDSLDVTALANDLESALHRAEQAEQARDDALKQINVVTWKRHYEAMARISELEAKLSEAEATIKVYEKELQTTLDLYEGKLRVMRAALEPFAAKVHHDGVDAPYPEEHWIPLLDAAKAALKS